MTFYELVDQAIALLRERGRLSYRALKRQFHLDDARLDDLKFELIEVQGVARDQGGAILVLTGTVEPAAAPAAPPQRIPEPLSMATPPGDAEAERRQLSVLFCDLVGSTPLAAEVDPEELREVLRDYQYLCAGVVERFGGVIVRQVGDGLLVNFGYPRAHEDDAARAVRTGLAVIAALPELNADLGRRLPALHAHPLQVRIGVHTGLVVVGALGHGTYHDPMAVVGETPNIAARLQGLAAPDTVIVSGATHRLLGGAFVCEDLGRQALKGMAAPVAVHRVVREGEVREPAPTGSAGRPTPLLGREQEFGMLLDRWEQSKEGLGQFVLLSGEAGIGKSRLVRELKGRVGEEPRIVLEGRGSPYHQQSAFHPWIDLLERALRFDRGDSPEARLDKLTGVLREHRLPVQAMLPVFATLLGLPAPAAPDGPLPLTPQRQRQQTLEVLRELVLQLAAQQPVLMIIEDLHWADPSTLEALELLLQQAQTVRLLLVLTARPEFHEPWASRVHLTHLTLTRLRRAQIEGLVAAMSEGRALPAEVVEQVARKTDGVPLFVEELTKMVLESGLVREGAGGYELAGPLPPLAIPATLQDSLMARLDRLSTTKVVAQVGATLGRTFTYEVVQAVTGLDEAPLTLELTKLVEAELLYQRGLPPSATYSFKHALIQDAAYQTLLKSTRQQYHQRVAQVLETQFADTVQAQPELLAHHYTEAGLGGQAIPYWQRAGQRAIERFANLEAIAHLTRGLELLETLPDTSVRVQRELQLLTALGPASILAKGQGAPDVERAYTRARELCRHVGETPQLFPVLWGLWHFHMARAEYSTARELGDQLLGVAERAHDPALLLLAHRALGPIDYFQGELAASRVHLEQAITLYDPRQHRSLVFQYAQDPGVTCRPFAASVLWLLGYPDQGLKMAREAVTLARELAHPSSCAMALSGMVGAHHYRREIQEVQKQIEEQIALIAEHGLTYLLAPVTIMRGWALAELGRGDEGIAQMCAGIAAMQARKAEIFRPYWLTLLAESYGKVGQVSEGLRVVGDAMAATRKTGERFWEAESYRIKGELLLRQSTERDSAGSGSRKTALVAEPSVLSAATECFHQAVDVARRQQAKSLELRVTVSLCRLWQGQGRTEDARLRLAEVYEWFTEGFDTPDLEEAKAMLAALA